MLLKYSETYRHKIIDTKTVVSFFNKESGLNLTPVFDQYLRHTNIPKLELRIKKGKLQFRWIADESNFAMPVDIKVKDKKIRVTPTLNWTKSKIKINSLEEAQVLTNYFFINTN
jgi:aminopeptidase N